MKGIYVAGALVFCLLFGTVGFAQEGISASLGGTVSDATGALIPGVEVKASEATNVGAKNPAPAQVADKASSGKGE